MPICRTSSGSQSDRGVARLQGLSVGSGTGLVIQYQFGTGLTSSRRPAETVPGRIVPPAPPIGQQIGGVAAEGMRPRLASAQEEGGARCPGGDRKEGGRPSKPQCRTPPSDDRRHPRLLSQASSRSKHLPGMARACWKLRCSGNPLFARPVAVSTGGARRMAACQPPCGERPPSITRCRSGTAPPC